MEKNRIHPVQSGKTLRMSFATQKDVIEMPNLIQIQKASYEWFVTEGLKEVFADYSPIHREGSPFSLSFVDFKIQYEKIKYSIPECKLREATYAAPLSVTVQLSNPEKQELKEHEIFMGNIPLMTDNGSFVINGAERVIVSQIVRSPGIYFTLKHDKYGKKLFNAQVIPTRGAWLEYETDSNDQFWLKLDRNSKVPFTVMLRMLGYESNESILELFGDEPKVRATLAKDDTKDAESAYRKLYNKLRPGDPCIFESAKRLIDNMLYDVHRYDLSRVGRYKFNKKLNFAYRLEGRVLADKVVDPRTGEILFKKGTELSRADGLAIQNAGVPYVMLLADNNAKDGRVFKAISSKMVDFREYLPELPKSINLKELGIPENVSADAVDEFWQENKKLKVEEMKQALVSNRTKLMPLHITPEEIIASINYLLGLEYGIGTFDDIDHLGNRRIRAVGELLQNQFRIGMSRMEKTILERLDTQDPDAITPQSVINIKPVVAALNEFFGSSQLSQFMDQNNPLAELTHKRRLSALGPGGLSRDRAGFEVRDIHYTHYGRMCPIETPEGQNIGLINSLASFARVNEYGFIEAPYRVVNKKAKGGPVVTDEVIYLPADEEDDYYVAQANTLLDKNNHFVNDKVLGRHREGMTEFDKSQIDLMDVSPRMVFSVATASIPFLENDDANRALMGSNMQRQAVPLMITETAVIDTGLSEKVATDTGVCQVAKSNGTVLKTTANEIEIKTDKGEVEKYELTKFLRSNQSTSYNQRPIVSIGEKVVKGEVIADGPSTCNGELALGKNPLIGLMTWEGYNYEDAVLLSERLVAEDVYTSLHIEKYEVSARETKLGNEEITNDIPGVGPEAIKDLGEDGIIRIGAVVRAGDILVGKTTPKGDSIEDAFDKLLFSMFRDNAKEVRDTSLKLPHGAYGTVIAAQSYTKKDSDELKPGVIQVVRVYVAQKRKISVGDKMAGRHGNKGVVSRVLPVEDMPFLPNGRPLDIVLNPLGVPSRMNIGQVLEIHLSLAAKILGINIQTPVFDGANEKDIGSMLEMANDYVNTEWADFKKKYKTILSDDVMDYLGSHLEHRELWKGVPISRDGKVQLRDGRTGEPFDAPVTIGHMHYLKLHHLVDDKIHARSTGPYSLVTQQPLGGKAQFGGQRFGEMEVWALEAYGAAYTLQEMLTIKSDDISGRERTAEAITKGECVPRANRPESFKVLIKELQALCLDVELLDASGKVVEIKEKAAVRNSSYHKKVGKDLQFRARLETNKTENQEAEEAEEKEE